MIVSLLFYGLFPVHLPQKLLIPSGSHQRIVAHLSKNGVDILPVDRFFFKLFGDPKQGVWQTPSPTLSTFDVIGSLSTYQSSTMMMMLIPGETTPIFFEQLEKKFALSSELLAYEYALHTPPLEEGFLVPQSYALPSVISEKAVIETLLGYAQKFHAPLRKKFGDHVWKQILIKASIVQKEAASKEEMPLVASVINNRLRIGMPLQMDGTLNYGRYSHIRVTPQRIKEDTTTYNTYKHKGLPQIPVCGVSKEAILAVIYPAKTPYLYFMKQKNGSHAFSNSYKVHLQNINNVKK